MRLNPCWLATLLLALACGGTSSSEPSPEPSRPRLDILATYPSGEPVGGATVSLDGEVLGQTSAEGRFFVEEPSEGDRHLVLRKEEAESEFSHTELTVQVTARQLEVAIELPEPARLKEPLAVHSTRVHLAWEPTLKKEKDFREYQIHVGLTPAVGDKTWRMVYVETDIQRTDYLVTNPFPGPGQYIQPDRDHYFRVYVLMADGSMAGSNVLKVRTPLWEDTRHFDRFYRLELESNFAGAAPIHGITFDGEYLWLLYRREVGGYYDPDDLSLVRYDHLTGTVLKKFSFQNHLVPSGLAWDGQALWVSCCFHPTGQLQRFNASTGEIERTFATEYGTLGLTWNGTSLVLNKYWPQILTVNPANGGITGEVPNPFRFNTFNSNRGIAYRPGELWLTNKYVPHIAVVDDEGHHVAALPNPYGLTHLTFMGPDRLVGSTESGQVYILRVVSNTAP